MPITGRIMIKISTDIYHHCGPRVAFCAATSSGIVCTLENDRNSASRYSFQQNTSTNRNVATIASATQPRNSPITPSFGWYSKRVNAYEAVVPNASASAELINETATV